MERTKSDSFENGIGAMPMPPSMDQQCSIGRESLRSRLERDRGYLIARLAKIEESIKDLTYLEHALGGKQILEKIESAFNC